MCASRFKPCTAIKLKLPSVRLPCSTLTSGTSVVCLCVCVCVPAGEMGVCYWKEKSRSLMVSKHKVVAVFFFLFNVYTRGNTARTRVCTTSFVTSSLVKMIWVCGDRIVFQHRMFNVKRNTLKTVCDPICQTTSEGGHFEHKCKCLQSTHNNSKGL